MASKIAARMHLAVGSGARLVAEAACRPLLLPRLHPARPLGVQAGAFAQRRRDRLERERRGREDLRFPAPVVDKFAGGVGDADEAGVREHRRRPVAHLVVELAADHDHEIGVAHRRPRIAPAKEGWSGRDEPAAFLRIEVERAGGVE